MAKDKLARAKEKRARMMPGSQQYIDQNARIRGYERTGCFAQMKDSDRKKPFGGLFG